MAGEFLTQEEADSILCRILGWDENSRQEADAPAGAVKPFELGKQERMVRGRMPTLEIINERFGRNLKIGLFGFIRKNPEVTVGSVRVHKYADFIRNLAVPTNINIVNLHPFKGNSLFIFDPGLVDTAVDASFGGKNQFKSKIEGRDFTDTEQRIISSMLDVVFAEYTKSWAPVYKIAPEYVRSEMHTQFANIANPSEMVVSTSFSIEIGSSGGTFHICFPYSAIEPVREILCSSMQGDTVEPDDRWSDALERQVHLTKMEVIARLAKTKISLGQVSSLQPGDLIYLDIPETVDASIEGVPIMNCKFGSRNGHYSLKVQKVFDDQIGEALLPKVTSK